MMFQAMEVADGHPEARQEVMGAVELRSSRLLRLSQFHQAEADTVSIE